MTSGPTLRGVVPFLALVVILLVVALLWLRPGSLHEDVPENGGAVSANAGPGLLVQG